MLFISHDLAVVRSLADSVGVLFRGQLMEIGSNEDVFAPPYHPYTHTLLMAVPSIAARRTKQRRPATAAAPARQGGACAFAGRCPWQPGPICREVDPPWRVTDKGLAIRCHLPLPDLAARAEWGRVNIFPALKDGDFRKE
jgi:peptide/nickel transport system ATP-binding protein